ncbi:hypothetical protein E4U59_000873 [Claviceps monticola]|nr:hypothetical protein E4U59_000873 [Claviceps monticola]
MTYESNDAPGQQLHRKEEGLTHIQRHDMQGPMRLSALLRNIYRDSSGLALATPTFNTTNRHIMMELALEIKDRRASPARIHGPSHMHGSQVIIEELVAPLLQLKRFHQFLADLGVVFSASTP